MDVWINMRMIILVIEQSRIPIMTMKNFKMLFFNMEIMIIIFIKKIYKDKIVENPQHKHNRIQIIESLIRLMLIHQEINGGYFK